MGACGCGRGRMLTDDDDDDDDAGWLRVVGCVCVCESNGAPERIIRVRCVCTKLVAHYWDFDRVCPTTTTTTIACSG